MAIVVFNIDEFVARYPEFASVSPTTLALYFSDAGLYCNNTNGSIIKDLTRRKAMLYALTAHIAALSASGSRGALVGVINSATEGSVSASVSTAPLTQSNEWFMQTQYGATFWRLSAPYRSAIYVPPTRPISVFVPEA